MKMATVHRGKQSLGGRARRYFLKGAACGGAFIGVEYLIMRGGFAGDFPWLLALPFAWLWAMAFYLRRYRRMYFGAAGERKALSALKKLPSSYHVFTNFVMRQNGGFDEADFVVVGKRGVFVIEVKHHAGVIEGRFDEAEWRQEKRRGKGGKEIRRIKNPLRQTARHLANVEKLLRRAGFHADTQAVLVFTNPHVWLKIRSRGGNIPALKGCDGMEAFILNHCPREELDKGRIKAIVRLLRQGGG